MHTKRMGTTILSLVLLFLLVQNGYAAAQQSMIADAPTLARESAFLPTYLKQLQQQRDNWAAPAVLRHTIARGETLKMIAKEYGISIEQLISSNNISDPNVIYAGQVLTFTKGKAASQASEAPLTHTLQRGETIWNLAKRYNAQVSAILTVNNIADPTKLEVGRVLVIPKGSKPSSSNTTRVLAARGSGGNLRHSEGNASRVISRHGRDISFTQGYTVSATAYCAGTAASGCPINSKGHSVCTGSYNDGITASGRRAVAGDGSEANPHLVAVDPKVIPLGSRLYIDGYGFALAADTGSAIKGNRLDLLLPSHQTALQFGRRQLQIYLLPQ